MTYDSTDGANALKIAPIPAYVPERDDSKKRTTLSLVPNLARRRRRPMMLAIAVFSIIVIAVVGMLVISITMANSQYDVVGLKGQERSLSQENEALRQQANFLQAPQNVAKKAAKLGMVEPGVPAAIDLATGKVTGKATPAKKGETSKSLIKAPAKPKSEVTAPRQPKAGKTPDKAAGSPSTPADRQQPASTGQAETAGAGNGMRQSFTAKELNGGTIPAPTVRSSGK